MTNPDRPNLAPIHDAAERAMRDELRRWTVPVPDELLLALARAVVGTLRDASMLNYDRPWELDDRLADVLTNAGEQPWARRAAAAGGGPCGTCGKPFYTHVCLSCSPDFQSPGPGCINCRNTGMDQTPCLPPPIARPEVP